jgi:hypothetical protein
LLWSDGVLAIIIRDQQMQTIYDDDTAEEIKTSSLVWSPSLSAAVAMVVGEVVADCSLLGIARCCSQVSAIERIVCEGPVCFRSWHRTKPYLCQHHSFQLHAVAEPSDSLVPEAVGELARSIVDVAHAVLRYR